MDVFFISTFDFWTSEIYVQHRNVQLCTIPVIVIVESGGKTPKIKNLIKSFSHV